MNLCFARRTILVLALLGAQWAGEVVAQAFPNRSITWIVPFPPGGGTDTSARVIARKLGENLGQSIVIDNRPGGNTIIGTEAGVRAAPDGYTILFVLNNLSVNQSLYRGKLPYDVFRDLAPIALTHGNAHVLLVHPSVQANTLQEFIALAKKKPGAITFVSAGSGSTNHLAGELLKSMAGIDMLHIPYKGIGTLMPDLLSGKTDVLFGALPIAMDLTRDKRMRMLAVTTEKRQPEVPDMPAIAELYPGFAFSSWFGVMAPAKTPAAIINRLNAEFLKALKDPAVVSGLANFEIFGSTPAEFADFIKADIEKSARVIQAAGAKLD